MSTNTETLQNDVYHIFTAVYMYAMHTIEINVYSFAIPFLQYSFLLKNLYRLTIVVGNGVEMLTCYKRVCPILKTKMKHSLLS